MVDKFMPVRVLYTISGSPQCMLARTLTPATVSVITINPTSPTVYGKTRLDTCIQALNRSSPELLNEDESDYSVYLLDPLESHMQRPVASTSSQPQSSDVAVGLGLLSSLTESADEVYVTGTVSQGPGGVESLEVTFNLKELKRKAKPPTKPSKKPVAKKTQKSAPREYPPLPPAGLNPSTVYNVEQRHRHYPNKVELYPSHYQRSHSVPQLPPPPNLVPAANPPATPVLESRPPSLQALLSVLSASQNTDAVLSMLSLIDAHKTSSTQPASSSSHTVSPDPALSEALRNLLAGAAPKSLPTKTSNPSPAYDSALRDLPTPSSAEESTPSSTPADLSSPPPSSQEELVLFDKENFDPASNAKSSSEGEDKENSTFSRTPSFSSPPKPHTRPVSGTPKKKRSHTEMAGENDPPTQRLRGSSTIREDGRIDVDFVRHRLQELSSQAQSEPSHGWTYSSFQSSSWATAQYKNAQTVASGSSGSEPSSSSATSTRAVEMNDSRSKKRFVVPDWAKTKTATIPRLSQDPVPKVEPESGVPDPDAKPKGNRKGRPPGPSQRKRKAASVAPSSSQETEEEREKPVKSQPSGPVTPKRKSVKVARKASGIDLPIVATSSPVIFNSSPLASHSSSSMLMGPPKTPTRKRRNSSPSRTPRRSSARAKSPSPLFTPGSGSSVTPKLPSLFNSCSPLFRGRSSPPELARTSKAKEARLMNSLPGASSDVEEEPEVEEITPMKLLSSSPPPSSPVLTSSDGGVHLPLLTTNPPADDELGTETDFMHDFSWLSNHDPCSNIDHPSFSEFDKFVNGALHGTDASVSSDDDARFADEIFNWSSADETGDEFELGEFWNSVKPLMGDGEVAPAGVGGKLANDMVDLFGGCLM